jgi:hypothetical protein
LIEKFNFYDIYGYVIPGLVLLGILLAPFGAVQPLLLATLLASKSFAAALSYGAVVLVCGYILGHILQTVASQVFPSEQKGRSPGDLVLDKHNPSFTDSFKDRLAIHVRAAFHMDLGVKAEAVTPEIMNIRKDALFLCRSALITGGVPSYCQQFEGLYSMMRGLTAAFGIAVAYWAGWGASILKIPWPIEIVVWVIAAASGIVATVMALRVALDGDLDAAQRHRLHVEMAICFLASAIALGYGFGWRRVTHSHQAFGMWALALAASFAAFRCFGAFKAFAGEFAKAVWRDFAASRNLPANPPHAN